MKRALFFLAFLLFISPSFSQEKKIETPKDGWTIKGIITFLFNQSSFSNWKSGGENTLAGNIGVNYKFNYLHQNLSLKNKITSSYGLTKSKSTEFEKKTDDQLEFNSLLGVKAENNWFYSVIFNFKTQFTKGYIYSKDTNGKEIRKEYTDFLSPATFLLGPGMLWEKDENFKFNLAPATSKLVIVDQKYTKSEEEYFGVEEGKSSRFELGMSATGLLKFNLAENISVENSIAIYSNYLEDFKNIDLDYTIAVEMKVNHALTTNFIYQTVYDDNAFQGFQSREVFGIAFNYGF